MPPPVRQEPSQAPDSKCESQRKSAALVDGHRALDSLVTRNSPGDTPTGAGGWSFCADQDCGLHSGVPWSHLWSHSCKFSGVRSGLPSLGSGATGPNRTGLNHQPQNSKAREGQPSAGSNPAATASPNRKCQSFYKPTSDRRAK